MTGSTAESVGAVSVVEELEEVPVVGATIDDALNDAGGTSCTEDAGGAGRAEDEGGTGCADDAGRTCREEDAGTTG